MRLLIKQYRNRNVRQINQLEYRANLHILYVMKE